MTFRTVLSSWALGLFALGHAWSDPIVSASHPRIEMQAGQSDAAAGDAGAAKPDAAEALRAPANAAAAPIAASLNPSQGAYREHAPLALFSLGSLAVGGVFFGIDQSMQRPNVDYTAGDRSQLTTAMMAAGITAVLAAGSYFYFVHRSASRAREADPPAWDAEVTGGLDAGGGAAVGARVTVPLPSAR
jgi:hypothetical protein